LALVAGMLGEVEGALPKNRRLTTVEESLCEHLVQDVFLASIRDTSLAVEPLIMTLGRKEPYPRRSRVLRPDENAVVCVFTLRGPFGDLPWAWVVPQEGLREQLARCGPEASQEELVRPRLESIVRELSIELSVALGTAELTLSQLAGLRAGDVVVLNQRVFEPLVAAIAGEKKFRVWPGRVASRQACQIESFVEC
jgi:flagellar motor switch protein FliM